jgi:hypothetical protein
MPLPAFVIPAAMAIGSALLGKKDQKAQAAASRPQWLSQPKPTDPDYWNKIDQFQNFAMSPQWSNTEGSTSGFSTTNTDQLTAPEVSPEYKGMEGVLRGRAMANLLEPGGVPAGTEARLTRGINSQFRGAADAASERAGLSGLDGGPNPSLDMIDMARRTALLDLPSQIQAMGDQREAAAMAQAQGLVGQFGTGTRNRGTSTTRSNSTSRSSTQGKGQVDPMMAQLQLWGAGGNDPNGQWYVPGQQAPSTGSSMLSNLMYLYGSGAFGKTKNPGSVGMPTGGPDIGPLAPYVQPYGG